MTAMTRNVLLGLGLVVAGLVLLPGEAAYSQDKQKELTELWIFNGADSNANAKTAEGKVFRPFDVYPVGRAKKDVFINHQVEAKTLDKSAKGTVCELAFRLRRDQFAGVRFTPDGDPAGKHPGINVKRVLFLDSTKPAYLVIRARTLKDATAKVEFKIGGVGGGGKYSDGTKEHPWRFPEAKEAELTDEWKEYEIPLRGKHMELENVVCPLTVAVDGNDNGGEPVTVYISEVRFTTKR